MPSFSHQPWECMKLWVVKPALKHLRCGLDLFLTNKKVFHPECWQWTMTHTAVWNEIQTQSCTRLSMVSWLTVSLIMVNSWCPILHSVRWPSPYACPGKSVEMSCPTPEFDGTWNVSLNAPLFYYRGWSHPSTSLIPRLSWYVGIAIWVIMYTVSCSSDPAFQTQATLVWWCEVWDLQ